MEQDEKDRQARLMVEAKKDQVILDQGRFMAELEREHAKSRVALEAELARLRFAIEFVLDDLADVQIANACEDAATRYARLVRDAAGMLVAVADDSGRSLVDVIKEMERFIVDETKVGDATRDGVEPGRRGYTLREGRLVEAPRGGK